MLWLNIIRQYIFLKTRVPDLNSGLRKGSDKRSVRVNVSGMPKRNAVLSKHLKLDSPRKDATVYQRCLLWARGKEGKPCVACAQAQKCKPSDSGCLSPVTEAPDQNSFLARKKHNWHIELHLPTFHKTLQNLERRGKHWAQIFKTICISLNERNSVRQRNWKKKKKKTRTA